MSFVPDSAHGLIKEMVYFSIWETRGPGNEFVLLNN